MPPDLAWAQYLDKYLDLAISITFQVTGSNSWALLLLSFCQCSYHSSPTYKKGSSRCCYLVRPVISGHSSDPSALSVYTVLLYTVCFCINILDTSS